MHVAPLSRSVAAHTPGRVLVVSDQPVLAKVIALALNHGRFVTHVVPTEKAATAALREWQPQLAVIDMDLARGQILAQIGPGHGGGAAVPGGGADAAGRSADEARGL